MKKIFFTLIIGFISMTCFSNTNENITKKIKPTELEFVCCTRSAYSGQPKTSSWNYVSVTVCERKTSNTTQLSVCAKATELANKSLAIAAETATDFEF
ncbi:MAG: hypothetical protein ACOVLC_14285 [Flavobacterium sp.]|jgi:hypothetical protein